MDKTQFSKRRLIENELLFRRKNKAAKNAIKEFYEDFDIDLDNEALQFYCECSNDDCEERIEMAVEEYEKNHTRKDRFIVLPGHDTDTVEKVVQQYDDYVVVQKFDLAK